MKNLATLIISLLCAMLVHAEDEKVTTRAFLDGVSGQGWKALGEKDFAQVNCDPETCQFKKDGIIH